MKTTRSIRAAVAVAALLAVSGGANLLGQRASSLTEQEIQSSETKTALEALVRENASLQEKLRQAESSLVALQKNLATSGAESEVLKRKVNELMTRLEALGLDAVGDPSRLEQKLLKAVNNLRLAEQDRKSFREALIELSEASLRYRKASATEDVDARQNLEAATRRAAKALGIASSETVEPSTAPATLTDGLVVAVREELALIVANIGRKHGVQVGMPFQVFRNGEEIGTVRVVDVRELISGAVIEDLKSDNRHILAQDRLKVAAAQ
jgi:hypothetical protein